MYWKYSKNSFEKIMKKGRSKGASVPPINMVGPSIWCWLQIRDFDYKLMHLNNHMQIEVINLLKPFLALQSLNFVLGWMFLCFYYYLQENFGLYVLGFLVVVSLSILIWVICFCAINHVQFWFVVGSYISMLKYFNHLASNWNLIVCNEYYMNLMVWFVPCNHIIICLVNMFWLLCCLIRVIWFFYMCMIWNK